jgi:hypothetical protein
MRGAIIENGVVTNVILLSENFEGDSWGGKQLVVSEIAAIGDSYVNGQFVKPEPEIEPETPEQAAERLELALDGHIDSVAKSYRYTSIHTMVTYATSEHPTFGAEGKAAVLFRDACYAKAIEIQDAVQAGQRDIPTEAELIAEMPLITNFLE